MPFMDEPPGAHVSSAVSGAYGAVVRRLRGITLHTVDKEPKWRRRSRELLTGYKAPWS
jgi:hydrogenase small subunit